MKTGTKKLQSSQKTINKMTIICSYLSVRDRVAEWIKNKTPLIYIKQTYSNLKDTLR